MKAKLLKTITSDGKTLSIGDVVNVDNWRNLKSLVKTKYIELIEETPVKKSPEETVEKKVVTKKTVTKPTAKK